MNKTGLAFMTACASLCFIASGYVHAQSPVKVTAWGQHYGGKIQYRYQVQNLGNIPIYGFMIGLYEPESGQGHAELSVIPRSNSSTFWLPSQVANRPDEWGVKLFFPEESDKFALEWVEAGYYKSLWPAAEQLEYSPVARNPPISVPPQATVETFSVILDRPDYAYVNGHARVDYADKTYTFPISKGDTVAPDLNLSVQRVNQNEGNGHWANFDVKASVRDNYDPAPTLVFEPVTASHALQAGDVSIDAKHGAWKVKLRNVPGRTYQLRFTSDDAFGNKTVRTFDYISEKK